MGAGAEPTVMAWQDGERELWLSRAVALDHGRDEPGWVRVVTGADRLAELTPAQVSWLLAEGPEASARALLATPAMLMRHRQRIDVGRVAVARFGPDALPLALSGAAEHADLLGLLVQPFRGAEVAVLVAGWLRHLGSARLWARMWLARHPETAGAALVPAVLGRPGRARQNAGDALHRLAGTGHRPLLQKIAEGYGEAALAAVGNPVTGDGPRRVRTPGWTRLPGIRGGTGRPWSPAEAGRLVDGLRTSRLAGAPEPPPGDPAPGGAGMPLAVESSAAAQPLVHPPDPEVERLIGEGDRGSLAAFGRALLDEWLAEGMPAAAAWVVPAQAHLGDDATMDQLAPLVRSWPARSRFARAVDGFAVLATVGTDTALRHLLAIEEGMSGGPTNDRARAYLRQAAARRGLSVPQLADRLVPTHGLDAGFTLDYGPRTFSVVADDHLDVHVAGPDGRRLARPPKPGVRDTRPEAYQRFLRVRKDFRATAAAQAARLQRDMIAHRPRPARDLPAVLLPHPVLGPIARRLLWGEYAGGRLVRALRIAEDGSFADLHDSTAVVDEAASLVVVHPAELGGDLAGWTRTFTDYEVVQPFAQLHRPVVVLTPAERAATSLAGFGPLATDRVAGLLRELWQGNEFHPPGNVHTRVVQALPGGLAVVAELSPGVRPGGPGPAEQRITEIWADDEWSDHWQLARRIPLGACDPAALSEHLVRLRGMRT